LRSNGFDGSCNAAEPSLANCSGYDDATRYLYVPQQPAHGCRWSALSATDVGTIGGVEDKILPKLKHADHFGVLY
jgi:hypothetical protein